MNEDIPRFGAVVVFPDSPAHVSDLLWSMLRESTPAVEVIVIVDERSNPEVAGVVRSVVRADERVRVIDMERARGRNAALAAGLDSCTAPWVTVADANGLAIAGGYEELLSSLQTSGSDMAVGAAESIAKHRYRINRAVDAALDSDGQGIALADRPGLITDDLLCNRLVRRSLLQSIVRAEDPWLEELIVARLYVSSDQIDILPRSVVFCRDRATKSTDAPMSPDWIKNQTKIWSALTAAPLFVREIYAREVITRDVLSSKALDLLANGPDRDDTSDYVLRLSQALNSSSLSNLPIWKRWQLALIVLGHPALVDVAQSGGRTIRVDTVPHFDATRLLPDVWMPLGLRADEDVREAFIDRFVVRPDTNAESVGSGAAEIDISIVIPTYNVASYIDELLDSIRGAVGVKIEIIVVDDGSTDGTRDRVLAHQEADSRVRLVRSPGAGGGQARDAGIELARGEYLAFADGDDLVPPRAYAHLLSIARRSGADVVSGAYLKFFATSTWDAGTGFNQAYALPLENVTLDTHPQLARHRAVWNRLIRREHWLQTAFPFPGVPRSNDIVAMMSVILSARSIAVSSLPAYVYRDRPGAGSMTSAAGSADYTVSYFSEEAACAALVQQRNSVPVQREYWAMVLRSDAWNNILKYLGRRSGDAEEDRRVAEQIARLISRVPSVEFGQMKAENQAVWALAAAGKFEDARTMQRVEKSASDIRIWPLIRAIRSVEALPLVSSASKNSLALKYLMRRFISDPTWQTDGFSAAVPVLRRLLTDPKLPLTVVPNSLEERLAYAIKEGDVVACQQAISPTSPKIAATLRGGARTILTGDARGLQSNGVSRLVARLYGDSKRVRVPVSHLIFNGEEWSAEIDPSSLPRPGLWVMELEYEDSLGLRRSWLKIEDAAGGLLPHRMRRASAARIHKDRSLIRVREPLPRRIRHKVSRIFKK